jgi:hypothetical protein
MLEEAEVSLMINGGAAKHLAFGQKTMVVVAFLSANTAKSMQKSAKEGGKRRGKRKKKGKKEGKRWGGSCRGNRDLN